MAAVAPDLVSASLEYPERRVSISAGMRRWRLTYSSNEFITRRLSASVSAASSAPGPSNGKGDAAARNTLPDGMSFVSAAGCTAAGQVVTCALGTLAPDEGRRAVVVARIALAERDARAVRAHVAAAETAGVSGRITERVTSCRTPPTGSAYSAWVAQATSYPVPAKVCAVPTSKVTLSATPASAESLAGMTAE